MKKFTAILTALLIIAVLFAGCAKTADEGTQKPVEEVKTTDEPTKAPTEKPTAEPTEEPTEEPMAKPIRIATLAGPTGMGLIKILDDTSGKYEVSVYTSPDQIISKIVNNEVDAATIPSNLAAVLYSKTNGALQIVSVNTMGVLYICEIGDTVNSLSDLSGKTIYATGQGATPEYVLNKILNDNGLDDVTVEYMGSHPDLANAVAAGDIKLAMLPEPFVSTVTAKNPDVKVKIDLNTEWEAIFGEGTGMPMGVTVINKNFIAEHPEAVAMFMNDYSDSVDFVTNNMSMASELMVTHKIIGAASIALKAIPRSGISFITGDEAKDMLIEYFDVLFASNPKSVGGAIPENDIYFLP